MRIARQSSRIADPEMARAATEVVVESQRGENGVSARAAAGDHAPIAIHQTLIRQVPGAINGILHIHNSPVRIQTLAIGASEAGAAAVVHVEHGNTAAGPILNAEIERAGGIAGGPAMALDDE